MLVSQGAVLIVDSPDLIKTCAKFSGLRISFDRPTDRRWGFERDSETKVTLLYNFIQGNATI